MASNPSVTGNIKPGSGGPPADPELKALGKYAIRKRLGAGGMGAVYLATDTQLNRTVALKVLPRDKAENKTLVKRFKAEAQAAAHLKHDNIVTIFEAGAADGHLYIALEYVEGIDVHVLVSKRGVLPVKRSLDIIKQVTRALQHAHGQGIVHRDIKPSNLLIKRDGTVKLADMGLARSIDDTTETGITRAGTTVGTVDYMAPEQARDSKSADVRSDIYSLGCTWYQMLTGTPPYSEGSLTNKLHAHATKPPPDPREKNEAVPEAIVAVLHRMMAKSPDDRYQTPDELLADLESANLTREGVANQILAALADDEETAELGDKVATAAKRTPPPTPLPEAVYESDSAEEPVAAAPRARSRQKTKGRLPQLTADSGAETSERLKYVPLAIIGLVLLAVFWWIISWLASLEGGGELPPNQNPFAKDRLDVPEDALKASGAPKLAAGDAAVDGTASEANGTSPADANKTPAAESAGPNRSQRAPLLATADVLPPPAIGRAGESQHFPSWIDEVWARPIIADSSQSARSPPRIGSRPTRCLVPPPQGLPNLVVGRSLAGDSHFATLADAFRALPNEGGLVQLVGDGPFFLRPTHLTDHKQVLITAAFGSHPLIVLVPEDGKPPAGDVLFGLSGGRLVLDSVHLALMASQFPGSERVALVGVESGDLAVRNCSVTLLGNRAAATAAFLISGGPAGSGASRVLVDRTVVRGDGLTAVHVDHRHVDLLAVNSLFAPGSSPAVSLTDRTQPTQGIAEPASLRRVLRFVSTTVSAAKTAVEINAGRDPADPVATTLLSVNSIFTRADSLNPTAALLKLVEWPRSRRADRNGSRFRNLEFITEGSLLLGWNELVRLEPGPETIITSSAEWERQWGRPLQQPQIQSVAWPEGRIAASEISPDQFRRDSIQAAQVLATDSGRPGCAVDDLRVPEESSLLRAAGWLSRPSPPESLVHGIPNEAVVRIELAEQSDLGQALAAADLPDRARVVISGQGRHSSSAIVLNGKAIRLEFSSSPGKPLIIEPQRLSAHDTDKHHAFITANNATVEILNGRFEIPDAGEGTAPLWFMNLTGSHFRLKGCRISASPDSEERAGLIHWNNREMRPPRRGAGRGSNGALGLIVDSYLAHGGPIVTSRGPSALIVENSVGAASGRLFDLEAGGANSRSVLAIGHCTLSAGETFFHVQPSAAGERPSAPLTVFVEESVFVSANRRSNPRPVLLNVSESDIRDRHIVDWWGSANGFGEGISGWSEASDGRSGRRRSSDFPARWEQFWGPARVQHPTMLGRSELPNLFQRRNEDSGSFALAPNGLASQWGNGGRPIGARLDQVGPETAYAPESASVQTTGPRDEPTPSGTNPAARQPRKKPKPGF